MLYSAGYSPGRPGLGMAGHFPASQQQQQQQPGAAGAAPLRFHFATITPFRVWAFSLVPSRITFAACSVQTLSRFASRAHGSIACVRRHHIQDRAGFPPATGVATPGRPQASRIQDIQSGIVLSLPEFRAIPRTATIISSPRTLIAAFVGNPGSGLPNCQHFV